MNCGSCENVLKAPYDDRATQEVSPIFSLQPANADAGGDGVLYLVGDHRNQGPEPTAGGGGDSGVGRDDSEKAFFVTWTCDNSSIRKK